MAKDELTIQICNAFREIRRVGDNNLIAAKTGYTVVYTSMALNPKNPYQNAEITKAAVAIIEERKAERDRQALAIKE